MTDSENARQLGLARALAVFEELLAGRQRDEEPVDLDDLS
jgi:hypothetical protein